MVDNVVRFPARGHGKVEYFRLRAIEYMRLTGGSVLYATVEGMFKWTLNADGSINSVPYEPKPEVRVWLDEAAEFTPEVWDQLMRPTSPKDTP